MKKSSGHWKRGDFVFIGGTYVVRATGRYNWCSGPTYHLCQYELMHRDGSKSWEVPRTCDFIATTEDEIARARKFWAGSSV